MPRRLLTTVASRICLDLLGSARARRDTTWAMDPGATIRPSEWINGRVGRHTVDPADRYPRRVGRHGLPRRVDG